MAAGRVEDEHGNRDYTYPPTGELLTSVTTILGATQGKPWLPGWAAGLAAEYAIDNIDALLAMLKREGRDETVELAKSEAERVRNVKRDTGSYVHDVAEKLILWAASPDGQGDAIRLPDLPEWLWGATYDDDPIEDVVDWMVTGFTNWVADFGPRFLASEMTVFNQPLGWAGTLDIIAELTGYGIGRSELLFSAPGRVLTACVDVKTGRHPESTWREQVAAYRRARECLLNLGQIVPMPATDIGAVLHLRPEHERGYRFMPVSPERDARSWATFCKATDVFLDRKDAMPKPGRVVRPLRPDGTVPPPLVADLDGEGYGRSLAPLRNVGITDLEQVAAMTAGQVLAVKGVGKKVLESIRLMLADHGLHLAGEDLKEVA